MNDSLDVNDFIDGISQNRMNSYLKFSNNDLTLCYELYCYNLRLSQSLYIIFNTWEIVLRNALDKELTLIYGNLWYENENFLRHLPFGVRARLADTLMRLTNFQDNLSKDKLISELSLSFWVNLLSKKYWKYNGLYKSIWANKLLSKEYTPEKIQKKSVNILNIRNRIAHYEPIFLEHNLLEYYDFMLEFIESISIANLIHVKQNCNFHDVFKNTLDFKNLKKI